MPQIIFLQDLAIVMIVAGIVTVLCHLAKVPVVLGYILAGVLIGPHTPPFALISDQHAIETLSQLGIIFMMFSLGLDFSLRKLKQVGASALITSCLEIVLMIGVGYLIGQAFGWSPMDSLFLGAIISISSTTIILKAFEDLGLNRERFANLTFGILIVQDILGIVLIALLTGIAKTGTLQSWDAAVTVGQLAVFLVVSLVLGFIIVPRLIGFVARFRSSEMLLITVLGLCFGFTLLTVKLGFSLALGAFLMGAIIAEAKEIGKITSLTLPVRDMFTAVFFVSVGLLIDPKIIMDHAGPTIAITVAVIVGQVAFCTLGTYVAGHDFRSAMRVGMSLSQIGEFSFIIAALGLSLGVTSGFLFPIVVTVSALTTLTTPFLIKASDPLSGWIERKLPPTILSYLNLYSRWLAQFGKGRKHSQVRKILRRIAGQLTIFLGLISGSLLAAVFLSRVVMRFFPALGPWEWAVHSVLWLTAMVSAMPVYIAAYRKLRALGMILAELGITDTMGGNRKNEVRAVVANAILMFGLFILGGVTFGLSWAVLPPVNALIVLVLIAGLVLFLLRGSFNKIYFHGKAALIETFAQPMPMHDSDSAGMAETPGAGTAGLLMDAGLESLVLAEGMPASGRTLRELELKTLTGAFIVGIDRNGEQIINPDADEYLQAGDRVILLGSKAQLGAATKALGGG